MAVVRKSWCTFNLKIPLYCTWSFWTLTTEKQHDQRIVSLYLVIIFLQSKHCYLMQLFSLILIVLVKNNVGQLWRIGPHITFWSLKHFTQDKFIGNILEGCVQNKKIYMGLMCTITFAKLHLLHWPSPTRMRIGVMLQHYKKHSTADRNLLNDILKSAKIACNLLSLLM